MSFAPAVPSTSIALRKAGALAKLVGSALLHGGFMVAGGLGGLAVARRYALDETTSMLVGIGLGAAAEQVLAGAPFITSPTGMFGGASAPTQVGESTPTPNLGGADPRDPTRNAGPAPVTSEAPRGVPEAIVRGSR